MFVLRNSLYALILVAATYGVFYQSYKFGNPNFGNNDFFAYQAAVAQPFDLTATAAPFVLRQIPVIVSSWFEQLVGTYSTTVAFEQAAQYQPDMKGRYFALIATNYLAALAAMFLLFRTICRLYKEPAQEFLAFVLVLAFTTSFFYFPINVIGPLTQGWAWLALSLTLYLWCARGWVIAAVLTVLACMFIRESTLIIFGCALAYLTVFDPKDNLAFGSRAGKITLGLACFAAFIGYLYIRYRFAEGYDGQLQTAVHADNIQSFVLTENLFFQAILTQNHIFIGSLALLVCGAFRSLGLIVFVYSVMLVVAIGGGVNESTGRVMGETLPLMTLLMVPALVDKFGAARVMGRGAQEATDGSVPLRPADRAQRLNKKRLVA